MVDVNVYFHEYIEGILDYEFLDGYKARVAIVNDEVTVQSLGSQIVHTACSVSYISQNQAVDISKLLNNVSNERTEN
jgi:hypothetical protein